MNIATKALTAVGYTTAPKATLILKHPVKAVSAWAAYRAAKKVAPRRRVLAAATATMVAVPLAWKALRSRNGRKR